MPRVPYSLIDFSQAFDRGYSHSDMTMYRIQNLSVAPPPRQSSGLRDIAEEVTEDIAALLDTPEPPLTERMTPLTASERSRFRAAFGSVPKTSTPEATAAWIANVIYQRANAPSQQIGGLFGLKKKDPSATAPAAATAPGAPKTGFFTKMKTKFAKPAISPSSDQATPEPTPSDFSTPTPSPESVPAPEPVPASEPISPPESAPAPEPAVSAAVPESDGAACSLDAFSNELKELEDLVSATQKEATTPDTPSVADIPELTQQGGASPKKRIDAMAEQIKEIQKNLNKLPPDVKERVLEKLNRINQKIAELKGNKKKVDAAFKAPETAEAAERELSGLEKATGTTAEEVKTSAAEAAAAPASGPAPAPAPAPAPVPLSPEMAQNTFRAIMEVALGAFNAIKAAPVKPMLAAAIAIFLVLYLCILSVSYLIRMALEYADGKLRKNPVNRESMDYNVARSSDSLFSLELPENQGEVPPLQKIKNISIGIFKMIKAIFTSKNAYKYQLFILLPWLIMGFSAAGLYFVFQLKGGLNPVQTPGFVVGALIICFFQGVITLLLNNTIYLYGNQNLRVVSARVRSFNKYIYNRIYKTPKFLNYLTELQSNTFESIDAIKDTLRQVPKTISTLDLAKIMFSLNMYLHFHKLGLRNPNILDALTTFSPTYMLNVTGYSPADFLFRKITYVDDYGQIMVSVMRTLVDDELWASPPQKVIYEATMMLNEWAAGANNKANSMYVEDAQSPFIRMAVSMFIIQWLPVIILAIIFRKPENRAAITSVISEYARRGSA